MDGKHGVAWGWAVGKAAACHTPTLTPTLTLADELSIEH